VSYTRQDGVHAATRDDHGPVHPTHPTGYEADCSWCWLGYRHTEAAHEQSKAAVS
jgi:hypothetical protein